MSVKDNIHYPDYVNIKSFGLDFSDKNISAQKIQKKYQISSRQYRLLVRHLNEEMRVKPVEYSSPQLKYIYRDKYGSYVIRKRANDKYQYFGTYATSDEAKKARDKLIKYDWDKKILKK